MKKIVLKTLGIILIGVFLLQVPVTMAADSMNELKNQQAENEDKIEENKQKK